MLDRAINLLDGYLGDTDPNIGELSQEEIETQHPVLAALQILVALRDQTPRSAPIPMCAHGDAVCTYPCQGKARGHCTP